MSYELVEYTGNKSVDRYIKALNDNTIRDRYRHLRSEHRLYARFHESHGIYNGRIGLHVWESGRDCDGVTYGHVRFVECEDYAEYSKEMDDTFDWADGPIGWSIIPTDVLEEARDAEYSIDTYAEMDGY